MKAPLGRFPLRYLTGEEIAAGDRIRIAGEDDGVILAVFAPGTEDGRALGCGLRWISCFDNRSNHYICSFS